MPTHSNARKMIEQQRDHNDADAETMLKKANSSCWLFSSGKQIRLLIDQTGMAGEKPSNFTGRVVCCC